MSTLPPRIHLSVPHMGGAEQRYVDEAFRTNWLSTVGPNIDAFEGAFQARLGLPSVALGSGTAAMHLGLKLLGVGPGDEVLCPTLTFVASANPIRYLGAKPVFLDSERTSWNLDPALVAEFLEARAKEGRLPKALVVVHLYGQAADMDPLLAACRKHGVGVLEDAAEALGTTYKGRQAGTLAEVAAYSFNGNKIITTTGGGMLTAQRKEWADKARFWSTQAKDPGIAYEHTEMGFNYRLSNVLAGIGRGQLEVLDDRVKQRRAVRSRYVEAFTALEGLEAMPEAPWGLHTHWLSCFLVDERRLGLSRDALIQALSAQNIESRPVWKPMHLQPLNRDCLWGGGAVAEELFARGICLPSSSSLSADEQGRVVDTIRAAVGMNRSAA